VSAVFRHTPVFSRRPPPQHPAQSRVRWRAGRTLRLARRFLRSDSCLNRPHDHGGHNPPIVPPSHKMSQARKYSDSFTTLLISSPFPPRSLCSDRPAAFDGLHSLRNSHGLSSRARPRSGASPNFRASFSVILMIISCQMAQDESSRNLGPERHRIKPQDTPLRILPQRHAHPRMPSSSSSSSFSSCSSWLTPSISVHQRPSAVPLPSPPPTTRPPAPGAAGPRASPSPTRRTRRIRIPGPAGQPPQTAALLHRAGRARWRCAAHR